MIILAYVLLGLLVAATVLLETWLCYRKLHEFAPEREDMAVKGVANAILYGAFWPTALLFAAFILLSKLFATERG
jgi:hypothetical protein